MTRTELYNELHQVNHSREKRQHYSNLVIANPDLIPKVLDLLFDVNDKQSPKAAWILEFMCSARIENLIPYLEPFTQRMHTLHLDPAVRPAAKICELIATAYCSKTKNEIQSALTSAQKARIITTCFDYMITDQKVAPKAYAMRTLFLFGYTDDWIHPELKRILERDYASQSAAYKARARQIFKKLKKTAHSKTD